MATLQEKYISPQIRSAAKVLDVSLKVSLADLKKAYRVKLKENHPDLVSKDIVTPITELTNAYDVMKRYNSLREELAGQELRQDLQNYLSVYKVLLKKYSRRLSASKFQLCNLENRAYILSHLAQLVKNYEHLTDYSEYKLTRLFLQDLTRFHYLPLNLTITNVKERQGYHLYRKIIRKTTWTLEETFSSLNGTKNKITLWRDYLGEIENHRTALVDGDHTAYTGKIGFMPRMLKTIEALTEVFRDYKAILPISEYMQMIRSKPRRIFS